MSKLSACQCRGEAALSENRAYCSAVDCPASTAWYPTQAEAAAAWEKMQATGELGEPKGWWWERLTKIASPEGWKESWVSDGSMFKPNDRPDIRNITPLYPAAAKPHPAAPVVAFKWDSATDKPLPEDADIEAAHPMKTGNHKRFENALRLVSAKHSKYALVGLVNWLLSRIEAPRPAPQGDVADAFGLPEGWFLYKAEHQHSRISYKGDRHFPLPHAEGPWLVELQHFEGGLLTRGRGRSLREALSKACGEVRARTGKVMP